jgi:hypothetical protein
MSSPRRKKVCGRNPALGPGSCWFWWEGCPANVPDCHHRRMARLHACWTEHERALNVLIAEVLG